MKTEYILHGGKAQKVNSENNKFFKEILKNSPPKINILLVYFASDPDRDSINYELDTAQFERTRQGKEFKYEIAVPENFLEQIKQANIVYFGGGVTSNLLHALKFYSGLEHSFKGKVIVGESAGANSLALYSYSQAADTVLKGLGILPIKTICHYEEKYKGKLDNVAPETELLTLREYECRVFEL